MYHYQSMWNTRQYPRLHEVSAEIFGSGKLWVSIDRTNLKPPADPAHPEHNSQGFIHWDTDTLLYPNIPFRVQGVLALTDTDESMGGFQCIPELYRDLPDWIPSQPADRDPRRPDITGYTITSIPLRAGDMVIWSTLLPHGNGHNQSDQPRLAQYITLNPAEPENEELRQTRIGCWQERRPIPHRAFRGDPRGIEQHFGEPPVLTALGRKLLGLDSWD
jgi:ectoine hydroxylase-related dioxygenase (phytanoyl-CoA dioxygenase family)